MTAIVKTHFPWFTHSIALSLLYTHSQTQTHTHAYIHTHTKRVSGWYFITITNLYPLPGNRKADGGGGGVLSQYHYEKSGKFAKGHTPQKLSHIHTLLKHINITLDHHFNHLHPN